MPEERPPPPAETIRGALGPVRVGDRVQTLNDAEDNDEADNMWYTGTLVSIDEENNVAVLETSPGNEVRVHRQTLARVVDETESATEGDEAAEEAAEGPQLDVSSVDTTDDAGSSSK